MEVACRGHRIELVADGQLAGGIFRKGATGLDTDTDLQRAFVDAGAYAVGPAQLLAVDGDLER